MNKKISGETKHPDPFRIKLRAGFMLALIKKIKKTVNAGFTVFFISVSNKTILKK